MRPETEAWLVARLAALLYMLRVGAGAGVGIAAGLGIGALRADPAGFAFAVAIAALIAMFDVLAPTRKPPPR